MSDFKMTPEQYQAMRKMLDESWREDRRFDIPHPHWGYDYTPGGKGAQWIIPEGWVDPEKPDAAPEWPAVAILGAICGALIGTAIACLAVTVLH